MHLLRFLIIPFLIASSVFAESTPLLETIKKSENELEVSILFNLEPQELLYKDALHISVDHPDMYVSALQPQQEPLKRYDPATKETQLVYVDRAEFKVDVKQKNDTPLADAFLHLMYHINTDRGPGHITKPISFQNQSAQDESVIVQDEKNYNAINKNSEQAAPKKWSISENISQLIENTNSLPIRLALVFLLGLLLSLTPCIYPMIPITVGILHAQKSASLLGNFARAGAYTLGLATTFALLGLGASYTGPIYGKLLTHPIFILFIVSFLAYLALSMFGLYEMYVPRFMQQSGSHRSRSGSLLSAFLFGTASGTFASPCVSPGLILLLSIVATMGSMFMGFLFLFIFGVGLSTPLLIIGTFSSSLSLLPQAGMWMLEVKKLFGLLLFGVCFYYLSVIIPWHILMIFVALFLIAVGIVYLSADQTHTSRRWKKINNALGSLFIIGALLALSEGYKSYVACPHDDFWQTHYQEARTLALQENKKLFIDVWARYCSICKLINNSTLKDDAVRNALSNYIPLKIDGTDECEESYKYVKEKFKIVGLPAFLIVDPATESIEKRWSSELYQMPRDEFIHELNVHYKK
ncbi:MAG TPA: cytochrome c biogenesis protein CcdA [Candidatus Babeliales bacterium]|nr:cytochrome c biogenesis protein CcdA [Candidatus Babeliales bacterium]